MDVRKFYGKKALDYRISKVREEKIFELLPKKLKGIKVLDVGCATGYLGQKLEKRGAKVSGIDISTSVIKLARKVLTRAEVVDLNNQKIPCPKSSFDIVIASEVIEHLMNPFDVIKEISRVLRKDGDFIITTPNLLYWGNRLKFLIGEFSYTKSGVFDETHIHFYTYRTLVDDLQKSGFRILKENHVYAKGNVIIFLKKTFPGTFAYQFVISAKKS